MKLGIFVTHPVQYHVPIWRALSQIPWLTTTIHYFSDHSVTTGEQSGFGVPVVWDTSMLEGYDYSFVSKDADLSHPYRIRLPDKWFRRQKFDVFLIHGYTHAFERQIVRKAASLGAKVILRGELTDERKQSDLTKALVRKCYLKWFYSRVDAFCFIGHHAKKHLKNLGIEDARLFFSPYSVDTDAFERHYTAQTREVVREELELEDDTIVFLFCGKLIERKQPHLLLDAIELLRDRSKVALMVIGDGPLKAGVFERGRELLGRRFLGLGFINQSRIGQFYRAGDIFVLPSKFESWGLVVNEAMQFGLPAIVSDRVGCRDDLIEAGRTGYIFESGMAESLKAALEMCIVDRDRVRQMGSRARERMRLYTPRNSANGIIRAIRSLRS
jgi:glycosyltransferase involved in cell wall biosynthesis